MQVEEQNRVIGGQDAASALNRSLSDATAAFSQKLERLVTEHHAHEMQRVTAARLQSLRIVHANELAREARNERKKQLLQYELLVDELTAQNRALNRGERELQRENDHLSGKRLEGKIGDRCDFSVCSGSDLQTDADLATLEARLAEAHRAVSSERFRRRDLELKSAVRSQVVGELPSLTSGSHIRA